MHQYHILYTIDGDWAVVLPLPNDTASVVACSSEFPQGRYELEIANNGWYESDDARIIGAQHQKKIIRCALEDAVAQAKAWAKEYSS